MVYSPHHLFAPEVTSKTVVWLEFFHPYKHACEIIWKSPHFFPSFFAPLVHHLHPESTVSIKPKLKTIECYFVILRLIYPTIRESLQEAIDNSPPEHRAALVNIQLLFEFLLPVVRVCFLIRNLLCLVRYKITDSRFELVLLLPFGSVLN